MKDKRRKRLNKKQRKKAKLFSPLFVIFLIIVSLFVIVFNIFTHDYFKISQVFIDGNNILTDEQVLSKLENPIGVNIFTYKEEDSLDNLKKEDIIKNAKIEKEYPDKILVSIEEEYPFFITNYKNKEYLISNEGKVLDKEKEESNRRLIELKGIKNKPEVGKKILNNKNMIGLIENLQDYKYSLQIEQIDLENYDDIGIIINDIQINFGDIKNYKYKLKLLDSVLNDINDKGYKAYTISLDKGDDPVVEVDEKSLDQEDENN